MNSPLTFTFQIQRDPAMFRLENLYLILDVRLEDSDGTPSPTSTPSNSDVNDDSDGDDDGVQLDDDEGITEIRFCPEDTAKLQEMFDAMTHCQVRRESMRICSLARFLMDPIWQR